MFRYISTNKNEYNVRKVDELSERLLEKEKELVSSVGFFKTLKIKSEIKKLNKRINFHGSQVLEYEYNRANFNLS